jgi:hypothetical protein
VPDISELLSTAARTTQADPDLAVLERRAGSLRRRQRAVLSSGVLSLGLLVALLVRATGGASVDGLHEVPMTDGKSRPTASASSFNGPLPAEPSVATPPAGSRQPFPGAGSPTAGPVRSGRRSPNVQGPRPAATPSAESTDFPPAPSCHVSTRDLASGETKSCRFTATAPGGWRIKNGLTVGYVNRARAEVRVTRDGRTTTYGGQFSDPNACGDDVIRTGDLVTVTVQQTDVGTTDFDLAAGSGYDCPTS